jgi:DNA-3-methyladenine glycosylase
MRILTSTFFNHDAQKVAKKLLGKVIFHRVNGIWLTVRIIETEAYYIDEKGSHSSLGYTEKRKALFMPPGTIYMYYARGGDSMNISVSGEGNAVLIKSGYPYINKDTSPKMVNLMQRLNPQKNGEPRVFEKLCSGQTLLCKSLGLKVKEWDAKNFSSERLFIADVGYRPVTILQNVRLGIPKGRDDHLEYRFIDEKFLKFTTRGRK